MSDTIEQAREAVLIAVMRYRGGVAQPLSDEIPRALDAYAAAVRAEAQREAFEAGWRFCDDDTDRDGEHIQYNCATAFAAYLKGQP